ncbi:MAG: polysaccharide deacetylase family protein, partial [Eggerthellaceae bacterium]|nr:polysaccharide deacetylase family protein [Eggerthellaceae bacterium]
DVHGEKVLALTFDDGPWPETTDQILDILKEYNIKATFFVIGNQIHDAGAESVKRAYAEGHQICTHSYSHASGSGQGVNLGYMSSEERIAEIQKGLDAIADVTGKPASSVIRAPGGNFSLDVWKDVENLVSAEIGWDIDTQDWSRPGIDSIVSSLKSVTPGDIVLMHDGGGDRSQTVAALKEALPYLIEQGYTFVTIDELLEYGFVEKEISNDTN